MSSRDYKSNPYSHNDLASRFEKISRLGLKKYENSESRKANRETLQYFLKVKREMECEKRSRSRSRDSSLSAQSVKTSSSNIPLLKRLNKQGRASSIDGRSKSPANPDILFLVRDNKIVQVEPIWKNEVKTEDSSKEAVYKSPKLFKKCVSPAEWLKKRDSNGASHVSRSAKKSSPQKASNSQEISSNIVSKLMNFFNDEKENDARERKTMDKEDSPNNGKTRKEEQLSPNSLEFLNLKTLNSLCNIVKPHRIIVFNLSVLLILLGKAPKRWIRDGLDSFSDAEIWNEVNSVLRHTAEILAGALTLEQRIKENKVDEKMLQQAQGLLHNKHSYIQNDASLRTFRKENPFSETVSKIEEFLERIMKLSDSTSAGGSLVNKGNREKETLKSKLIGKMIESNHVDEVSEKEKYRSKKEKSELVRNGRENMTERNKMGDSKLEKTPRSFSDKKKIKKEDPKKLNRKGEKSDSIHRIENDIQDDIDTMRKEIKDIEAKKKKIIALYERELKQKEKQKEIDDLNGEIKRRNEEERRMKKILLEKKLEEEKYMKDLRKAAHENAIATKLIKKADEEKKSSDEHYKNSEDHYWRKKLENLEKEKKLKETKEKEFSFSIQKEALNQSMEESMKKKSLENSNQNKKQVEEKLKENQSAKKDLDRKLEETLNLINKIKLTSN